MIEVWPMEREQSDVQHFPEWPIKSPTQSSTVFLSSWACQQMQKVQNRTLRSYKSHKMGKAIKCVEPESLITAQNKGLS